MFIGQAFASLQLPCDEPAQPSSNSSSIDTPLHTKSTGHHHDHSMVKESSSNTQDDQGETTQHACQCPMGTCAAYLFSDEFYVSQYNQDEHQIYLAGVLSSHHSSVLYRPPISL